VGCSDPGRPTFPALRPVGDRGQRPVGAPGSRRSHGPIKNIIGTCARRCGSHPRAMIANIAIALEEDPSCQGPPPHAACNRACRTRNRHGSPPATRSSGRPFLRLNYLLAYRCIRRLPRLRRERGDGLPLGVVNLKKGVETSSFQDRLVAAGGAADRQLPMVNL
jgi:hypothetical protein